MIIVLIMRYKIIKKHYDSKKTENVKNKQNC